MSHDHNDGPDDPEVRTRALESLLYEKGLLTPTAVDRVIGVFEQDLGPLHGARVIARAWVDPEYRVRLLDDASAAIAELGYGLADEPMVALENTPEVHNVVVCTLCSCYPWGVLGLPPRWYKDPAYRSRIVIEPRMVLAEFGLDLDETVEVRVWDSSAEIRYLVVPEQPAGTQTMSEDELVHLVTRDSMIGVAKASTPVLPGRALDPPAHHQGGRVHLRHRQAPAGSGRLWQQVTKGPGSRPAGVANGVQADRVRPGPLAKGSTRHIWSPWSAPARRSSQANSSSDPTDQEVTGGDQHVA